VDAVAIARRLPAAAFLAAAFLAGGYQETTYTFLCAAVWFALAAAAALRPPPPPSPAVLALGALTTLTLASALWGEPGEAFRLAPLPAFYTGLLYASEWAGVGALLDLRLAIAVVAVAGIVGRASGLAAPSPEPGSIRMAWPVTYANGLGLVCACGVLLSLGLRPRRPLLAAVCLAALVWTFSRSAVAALALTGGALALATLARRRPRWAAAAVAAAAVAAAVAAVPLVDAFRAPAPDTRNAQRLVSVSGHGRTRLWHAAWAEGTARPILGGGAGSWHRTATTSSGLANLPANAHSLELETFAELGAIGLGLLAAFFVAVLAGARRSAPAVAVFAAWLLVSAVDWDWQLPAATAPALIAAAALTRRPGRLSSRGSLAVSATSFGVAVAAAVHLLGSPDAAGRQGLALSASRYTSSSAADASASSRRIRARAAAPSRSRALESSRRRPTARRNRSTSPTGTRMPSTSSSIASLRPPTSDATTALPHAIASRTTMP